MHFKKERFLDLTRLILITGAIFVFTCQVFSPDYAPGLDTSYMWGLNWLFVHDYESLQELIYPIGPLAMLKMPSYEGSNLIWALLFYLLVKCTFIVMGFKMADVFSSHKPFSSPDNSFSRWFVPSVFILTASYFANIDVLIIFTCILLCIHSILEQKIWSFLTASLLASLSLFIKISIGISALSAVGISLPLFYFEHRNVKKVLLRLAALACIFIVLSLAIFHHPRTLFNWYIGAVHLVFGYSSLSVNYNNHIVCLLLFLCVTLAAPFVCRDKAARYACLLSAIPIFAFWKHGIIREDCPHYFGMVYFMICFWMILSLLEKQRKGYILLLAAVAITCLSLNAKEMDGCHYKSREFSGATHVAEPYFHYRDFVKESDRITRACLQANQLPDTILQQIGQSSIDIYPFEFTYAAQNRLNWQPRTALGSALNPWLEAKSAENFSDDKDAAQFILWHFQYDRYGKYSSTIDDHYFLNEEPLVVKNILNHYELASRGDHLVLMKHTSVPALGATTLTKPFSAKWDDWIDVPQEKDAIVRIQARSQRNFWGKTAEFFYKDIIYSIEYETSDGQRYLYRYDPAFASEGLWCNPFVQTPCDLQPEAKVKRVRFIASDTHRVKNTLTCQFEIIKLTGKREPFLNK